MTYVDGFVLPLPKDKLDAYRAVAATAGAIWREHGALAYVECIADDVPYGERTSFPRAVETTADETVVFSWITYSSRAERDRINALVMADARITSSMANMPFDTRRMIWGGFETILEL